MRYWRTAASPFLHRYEQPLRKEKNQDQQDEEKRVLENQPGDAQPFAVSRYNPEQHRNPERDRGRETDDPDYEHLAELGGETSDACGRLFGALEHDGF